MDTVAFIFARGGSKGLPGKNIRPLLGKPLIAWSIEQALAVKRIKRVIVSTDSAEIAEIAKIYGAEVPFIRPGELSEDSSPEWMAWQHALDYCLSSTGVMPNIFISVPVTAPLRLALDIENCILKYDEGNFDSIITITESHRNPFFNMVKYGANGSVELVNTLNAAVTRRQDAPAVFDITTVCYVVSSLFVKTHTSIFDGRVGAVLIPSERAVDIDTLLDFEIAEFILKKRNKV